MYKRFGQSFADLALTGAVFAGSEKLVFGENLDEKTLKRSALSAASEYAATLAVDKWNVSALTIPMYASWDAVLSGAIYAWGSGQAGLDGRPMMTKFLHQAGVCVVASEIAKRVDVRGVLEPCACPPAAAQIAVSNGGVPQRSEGVLSRIAQRQPAANNFVDPNPGLMADLHDDSDMHI